MSNTLIIDGNLTADPELKFTGNGKAVVNFTIADTPRVLDKATGEWKDGDTLYMNCSMWRDAAEHVAESLRKGTRVVATGRLKQRSYEAKDGTKRTVIELDVSEIGPSLKYATAAVTKVARGGGSGQQQRVSVPDDFGGGWDSGSSDDSPPF